MPHTPGKWEVENLTVFDEDGFRIAECDSVEHAHLFKAAPMLLEAAKLVVANRDCVCGTLKACCICRLRAAIAAAEGGEDNG